MPKREPAPTLLRYILVEVETALWRVAINASKGDIAGAARALGVSRTYAHRRLGVLGLTDYVTRLRAVYAVHPNLKAKLVPVVQGLLELGPLARFFVPPVRSRRRAERRR